MVIDAIATETMSSLVKELGFPIASFIIAISVVIYMIRKNEERQKLSDNRYDRLVDQFIKTTEKISDDHKKFVDTMAKEIRDVTVTINVVSEKIDNLSELINDKVEAKSPFFVFKNKEDYNKYIEDMNINETNIKGPNIKGMTIKGVNVKNIKEMQK